MPNKTLYVRPEDEPVWAVAAEKAKREGRSLSRLVADALQRFLPTDDEAPVLIDRATIEIVLLDHREELDDDKGKVSPSLAELAHVYRGLTGFDAKVEAAKSCREILAELTSESIEAGTYDQPAEVIELTPEEYQQAAQHALDSIGCTMDGLADMARRGDYPTPAHRKVWLAIKPALAQPETPEQ